MGVKKQRKINIIFKGLRENKSPNYNNFIVIKTFKWGHNCKYWNFVYSKMTKTETEKRNNIKYKNSYWYLIEAQISSWNIYKYKVLNKTNKNPLL